MRHFSYLSPADQAQVFSHPPHPITPAGTDRAMLGLALGATLYCPGSRPDLAAATARAAAVGTTSMVWCLEDAVPHADVPAAETNVVAALREVWAAAEAGATWPLLFIRVRDADQIIRIADAAGPSLGALCGFSLPKVTVESSTAMLEAIATTSAARSRADSTAQPLFGMPILETAELAWVESRRPALAGLAEVFDSYDQHVLCVRIGGTDISGLFGLRRDSDTTVWDVGVVRDVLVDVINTFARVGRYVVTGVVWEHIGGMRLLKPQLRQSPFTGRGHTALRQAIIDSDVDALVREVVLDRANGMHGKTVIHPSHVGVVNALLTVSREEYDDAVAIVAAAGRGGVEPSAHGRMNEMGPHALWAGIILRRASVYGVLASPGSLVRLLAAGQQAYHDAYPAAAPRDAAARLHA